MFDAVYYVILRMLHRMVEVVLRQRLEADIRRPLVRYLLEHRNNWRDRQASYRVAQRESSFQRTRACWHHRLAVRTL